ARKLTFEVAGLKLEDPMPYTGKTVLDALLEPHISYARVMQVLMKVVQVRGMAHITGGGITENLPRILPEGLAAEIDLGSWIVPGIFRFLHETGNVVEEEMLRTFNMGQGLLFVVSSEQADKALETLELTNQKGTVVGRVTEGDGRVHYKGTLRYAD
ncbi:MAG TPA: AIR synthase-related protein, partial [Candidatus Hydrogenedentes bacterium]|nr:AIR synthase-related protein [Candidatus Hydrogenedentota bacterium]